MSPSAPARQELSKTLGLEGGSPRRRRWLLRAAVALAAAALAAATVLSRPPPAANVVTQPARRGELVVTVSATGTLEPRRQVDVGIEVSGTVETVDADHNDEVRVGQVMARLDTTRPHAQAQQNEAALRAARAQVLQARASVEEAAARLARLERVHALSAGKVPSQDDLDAARANLARYRADEASAQASVAQAQAALDVTRTDLSKAVIRSPINGVVLGRAVEPGQTVAASFEAPVLFTLAEDLTQMELHVDVDEADVGQVRAGQDARFTVDAYPDRAFLASITQVRFGARTVDGVVTYETVLQVDNADLALRPGMTATAVITVDRREDALLVPNAALRFAPAAPGAERRSGGRGLLGMILPGPPGRDGGAAGGQTGQSGEQRVWTLRDGRILPVPVVAGATDGVVTEVTGGQVEPGMPLVTEETGEAG